MSDGKLTLRSDGTFACDGATLYLTPARRLILIGLWARMGESVPADELHENHSTLKVQICHIRRRLREDGVTSHRLETTLQRGYGLVETKEDRR